jgi:hypothetical protein
MQQILSRRRGRMGHHLVRHKMTSSEQATYLHDQQVTVLRGGNDDIGAI